MSVILSERKKKYLYKIAFRANVSDYKFWTISSQIGQGFQRDGTVQCNFSGQRDRSSFIVPGQRYNGTSSKSCHKMGRAGTAYQTPGRDTGQNNHYFSVKICEKCDSITAWPQFTMQTFLARHKKRRYTSPLGVWEKGDQNNGGKAP